MKSLKRWILTLLVSILPNRIVYLCFLKVVSLATQNRAGKGSAVNIPKLLQSLTVAEVAGIWEARHNKKQFNRIVKGKK